MQKHSTIVSSSNSITQFFTRRKQMNSNVATNYYFCLMKSHVTLIRPKTVVACFCLWCFFFLQSLHLICYLTRDLVHFTVLKKKKLPIRRNTSKCFVWPCIITTNIIFIHFIKKRIIIWIIPHRYQSRRILLNITHWLTNRSHK